MATFKELTSADKKTAKSFLNQLVDVIQEDISGSTTRKKYQVFVTGGVGPGVTSSLFETVYDQDFSLQTSNPVFDLTIGIFSGSSLVATASTGQDSTGKLLFQSSSLMMREKISNYKQFAQLLLGDADSQFTAPFSNAGSNADKTPGLYPPSNFIDAAMFVCFKRLFSRDMIKRESFAMRFFTSASHDYAAGTNATQKPNLNQTSESGSAIFTDVGAATNQETSFGGTVGNIVNSANTAETVGLCFYEQGLCVFDMSKITSASQKVSGVIDAMSDSDPQGVGLGKTLIGSYNVERDGPGTGEFAGSTGGTTSGITTFGSWNHQAKFIPDMMVSASIDNIIDHLASCRFSSGSNTAITFQNLTAINSTLIFCRATADEFNYSSNPTYVDASTNKIRVIETGQEATQRAFSFLTTVGLYDANDNLLAVAKLSRPIEKNNEKDITIRVRLDF